jgi:RHS repeat-associated protein
MLLILRQAARRVAQGAATSVASIAAIAVLLLSMPAMAADSAHFVSQSVPAVMGAGQVYAVSVTMQNTGTTTWTSPANYNLGSQLPQDNYTWGAARVGLPASTSVAPGSSVTFSFNVTAPATVGSYNFEWRMVHDGVAWFGDFTTNVVVPVKQAQTVSFSALADKTIGDAPFSVSATASSGLAVGFSSSTSGVCTVSGSTVTMVGVGFCTVVASQAGNSTYAPAQAAQSFTVRNTQSIAGFAPATPIPYSPGATFTLSATGGASGNPVVFAATAAASGVCSVSGNVVSVLAAGTCVLTADQAGNASYGAAPQVTATVSITQAQTISFAPLSDQSFSTTPFQVSATASSGLPVSFGAATPSVCTVSGTAVTMVAVGTCTIAADQAGNNSYGPAAQVTQSFAIASGSVVYYVHPDHLGTPRAITRASDNAKVWEWRNDDPFGNNPPNEDPNSTGTSFRYNLRFGGMTYFDQETGTLQNTHRDLDLLSGRYIQSDPIGLYGGINTYAYVANSPVSAFDPYGLWSIESPPIF